MQTTIARSGAIRSDQALSSEFPFCQQQHSSSINSQTKSTGTNGKHESCTTESGTPWDRTSCKPSSRIRTPPAADSGNAQSSAEVVMQQNTRPCLAPLSTGNAILPRTTARWADRSQVMARPMTSTPSTPSMQSYQAMGVDNASGPMGRALRDGKRAGVVWSLWTHAGLGVTSLDGGRTLDEGPPLNIIRDLDQFLGRRRVVCIVQTA